MLRPVRMQPPPRPLRPVMVVPDFDRIGGYELQALALARHFQASGVPALLLANNPWDHAPREERDGVTIVRLPHSPPHRRNWASLFVAFLQFLRHHRHEYDVLHCHALTFLAACCARIGRLLAVPTVVKVATEHDVRAFRAQRSLHGRLFFRWLLRADRLLCLSESIRQEAIACGFRPDQAVLAPNGVDVDRFAPAAPAARAAARAALGLGDDTFTLLFVGRLVERKGVDVLLRALAATHTARRGRLLVVGDGTERARLEALARELAIDGAVQWAGEQTELLPFYAAADAFVFPSRREGLPNALLEAMACGLASVATRIGGCVDVVAEDSGVLVPADDVAALAAELDRLATDPAHRARLATAGRRRVVEAFSFAVTGARLQRIYAEVCGRADAAPTAAVVH